MEKSSIILPEWRRRLLENHLLITLILFELILSVVFLIISYLIGKIYLRGIAVSLIIAGLTSLVAYLFQIMAMKRKINN
ncbi:MAG: hypothetical protein RXP98_06540 [Thermoplasmata archaeon]